MADRTVRVRLEALTSQYQAKLRQAAASTKALGTTVTDTAKKHQAGTRAIGLGAVAVGGAMLYGFGKAVSAAMNFDKAMSGVAAVSSATASEMAKLREAALDAGAATVFSASDAARAEAELVKAGVAVADVLGGALRGSLDLAAAGQLDLGESATIAAQAMNLFNLRGSDVAHVADVLAAGANKSAADVSDLGMALKQGGLLAKQTGLDLEVTVGTLAAFSDNALVGSDAGTSLKTMLQRLTPESAKARSTMDELGISAFDSQGNFIGLAEFAGNLQTSLQDLSPEARATALEVMFGSDAVRGANILYELGETGIRKYTAAVDDQGAAQRMAAKQLDNLAGDIEQFKGSLETALIKSGSSANTVLRDMTQFATGAVNAYNDLPPAVQGATTAFLALGGVVSVGGGGLLVLTPLLGSAKKAMIELGIQAAVTRTAMLALPVGITIAAFYGLKAATDASADSLTKVLQTTRSLQGLHGGGVPQEQAREFEAGKDVLLAYAEALAGVGASSADVWDKTEAVTNALRRMGFDVMNMSVEETQAALEKLPPRLRATADNLANVGGGAEDAGDKLRRFAGMTSKEFDDWRESTREAINSVDDVLESFAGKAHVSADKILEAFSKQISRMEDYEDNWRKLLRRGLPDSLAKQLQDMGIEGAGIVQALANANDREFEQIIRKWLRAQGVSRSVANAVINDMERSGNKTRGYRNELDKIPPRKHTRVTADTRPASTAINRYLAALSDKEVTVMVNAQLRHHQTRHAGGWVHGAGDVPITAQSGEFVVNRKMARENAAVLEALNAGRVYHDGGWVGRPQVDLNMVKLAATIEEAQKSFLGGNLVQVAHQLIGMGFRISGHPAFPPIGLHTQGSYHYLDRAWDANYGPGGESAIEKAAIARVVPMLAALPHIELLHPANDPKHRDHLHYAMQRGALFGRPTSGFFSAGEREAEIVSPVSMMRQIVREEVRRLSMGIPGITGGFKDLDRLEGRLRRIIDNLASTIADDLEGAVRRAKTAAIKELTSMLNDVARKVERAQRHFDRLKEQATELRSSVVQSIGGFADLSSFEGTTEKDLHIFLKQQQNQAQQLARRIQELARLGLNQGALGQILSMGAEGIPLAQMLAGDPALIRILNQTFESIGRSAKETGAFVQGEYFGKELRQAGREVGRLTKQFDRLTRSIEDFRRQIDKAVERQERQDRREERQERREERREERAEDRPAGQGGGGKGNGKGKGTKLASGAYFTQPFAGFVSMAETRPEIVSPVPVLRQIVREESRPLGPMSLTGTMRIVDFERGLIEIVDGRIEEGVEPAIHKIVHRLPS